MNDKRELEILEYINSIPTPPVFRVLIVENGMVKLNQEVRNYFKYFNIELKEVEPVEKVKALCKSINSNKFLMVVII